MPSRFPQTSIPANRIRVPQTTPLPGIKKSPKAQVSIEVHHQNPDHAISTISAEAGPVLATAHHSAIRAEQADMGIDACAVQRSTESEFLP